MDFNLPILAAWSIGAAIFGAGGAWGVLTMRGQQALKRIESVERNCIEADEKLETQIGELKYEVNAHKEETTDRLARIETKMDVLLDIHTRRP